MKTLTETLLVLDITKTESVTVLLYIERKNESNVLIFFNDGKQHKARKLDMVPLEISA